jgi:hypothetical protein
MDLAPEMKIGPAAKANNSEPRSEVMTTRRKISDLISTQDKMQTRNIPLRSKQSLHPIHGGLRPPSLFSIETKLAHSKN